MTPHGLRLLTRHRYDAGNGRREEGLGHGEPHGEDRKLSDTTRVTREAARTSWGLGLRTGNKLSVRNLLYAMMLPSANDAACASGIEVAGSTKRFEL